MKQDVPASLRVNAAWLDKTGVIVSVNDNWKAFGVDNGLGCAHSGVGQNYLDLCRSALGPMHRLTVQLKALLEGRAALLSWIYSCHAPDRNRWYHLIGAPRDEGAVLAHTDISEFIGERGWRAGPIVESSLAALRPVVMWHEPDSGLQEEVLPKLTRRQAQVLLLIRQGKGNAEIAEALGLSNSVIKKHVTALLRAFGLKRRYELVIPRTRSGFAAE